MTETEPETVLWTGRPSWRALAARVFHIRAIAAYFAVLIALTALAAPASGWKACVTGCLVTGLAALFGYLTARTTRYEITTHRLIMRYGIALPATLAIPHGAVARVQLRLNGDRTGDVSLRLIPGQRIAYPKLWPHARPWRWSPAEPMLRGLPDAAVAGPLLTRAITRAQEAWRTEERQAA